jgi:hypothetical protein
MRLAPVEYVVISFPGNQFNGEIVPAIERLVNSGTVHILDLVFVKKDIDGVTTSVEVADSEDGSLLVDIEGEAEGLFGDPDIELVAESLEPNSSALFILWEDLWAAELGRAVLDAGGELVVGERVPNAAVELALAGVGEE